jgi:hypothetical protein
MASSYQIGPFTYSTDSVYGYWEAVPAVPEPATLFLPIPAFMTALFVSGRKIANIQAAFFNLACLRPPTSRTQRQQEHE